MSYILHDAQVAWWAWRSRHPNHRELRLAITWPISIRRNSYSYSNEWIVAIQKPLLHILNAYEVDRDYHIERNSSIDI